MLAGTIARSNAIRLALVIGMIDVAAPTAQAQTLTADVVRDLPHGGSVLALLETAKPEVVSDRFNGAGLNAGGPARLSGLFGSWSQTRYGIGDVDVSSPVDGTPLLGLTLMPWQLVRATELRTPLAHAAPGLVVSLTPRAPAATWGGEIEVLVAGGELTATGARHPTPIATLNAFGSVNGLISGPLSDRIGLIGGAGWSRNEVVHRGSGTRRDRRLVAFVGTNVQFSGRSALSALGIVSESAGDDAVHVQAVWTREEPARPRWRVFGGYTAADRASLHESVSVIERVLDGPVPLVAADRSRNERLGSIGVVLQPTRAGSRYAVEVGVEMTHAAVEDHAVRAREIHETVDGLPARIWSYAAVPRSRRRATTSAARLEYRAALTPAVEVTLGTRYEHVAAAAERAARGVSWHNLLPAARVDWTLGTAVDLTLTAGARRVANRLLLGLLTAADPASPTADVFRWEPADGARDPLIARAGPGTRDDLELTALDARLRRSVVDEFDIGLTARPRSGLTLALHGVTRRQSNPARLVNVGVPADSYRLFTVRDDNADLVRADDDQDLPVYERLPHTFAQDRYLLTNVADTAKMGAIVVSAEISSPRLWMFIGGTASAAIGTGANRGFRAVENDQDVLGESHSNPNAATYGRGRLFSDRAYTIKWSTVYRLPWDMRLGVIARYQDGQPFTRLVIVPDLNQGAEMVQAFSRGRSRFAFTGTLDVRLQKGITLGASRLDLMLDVYNLPGMRKETEEHVVTGARFRETTATQPPRAAHVGLRARF